MSHKPDITLYHFCAAHMVQDIMREGLTLGVFTYKGEDATYAIRPRQWLTAEKDPGLQSWATQNLIKYDRTAYRLTKRIPGSYAGHLIRALEYVKDMPPLAAAIVTDWPGSDSWFLYCGKIPPQWIVGCRKMEGN